MECSSQTAGRGQESAATAGRQTLGPLGHDHSVPQASHHHKVWMHQAYVGHNDLTGNVQDGSFVAQPQCANNVGRDRDVTGERGVSVGGVRLQDGGLRQGSGGAENHAPDVWPPVNTRWATWQPSSFSETAVPFVT